MWGEAMKFITEMELRDLYKTEPFDTYILEPHIGITPEARQFLVDRGIKRVQAKSGDGKTATHSKVTLDPGRENWCVLRLRRRMEGIESLFLLVGANLLSGGDVVLAEEVLALGKCFRNVKNSERKLAVPDTIQFWEWSETEIRNCSNNLGNCTDIDEEHIRLEAGKTIASLNHLRASLREIEPDILEAYWDEERQVCSRHDLIDKVNLIINVLCIMMWKYRGGLKCKP